VLIDSDPAIPDRTLALVEGGPSPAPYLIRVAKRLEAMGADLLVMPCNTAHAFAPELARSVRIPLISWVDATVEHIAALEPRPARVAVLATTGTVAACIYQSALAAAGIEALTPGDDEQARVMSAIYGLKAGDKTQPAVIEVLKDLVANGADAVLLACTELTALKFDEIDLPVIDPAEVVVARVVVLAGGTVKRETRAA